MEEKGLDVTLAVFIGKVGRAEPDAEKSDLIGADSEVANLPGGKGYIRSVAELAILTKPVNDSGCDVELTGCTDSDAEPIDLMPEGEEDMEEKGLDVTLTVLGKVGRVVPDAKKSDLIGSDSEVANLFG